MSKTHASSWRMKVATAAAMTGVMVALSSAAVAHPHVWISVDTTVVLEQGSIVGFQHKWTFDEFYTAMAIQGLDTNNDGIYSNQELAELAQVNIDGLKEFKYFTFSRLGSAELAFDAAKDFRLEHAAATATKAAPPATPAAAPEPKVGMLSRIWGGLSGSQSDPKASPESAKVLTLEFMLPLKQPVLIDAPDFSFAVYDPTWFIAFDVPNTDAVRLGSGAPAGCRIDTGPAVGTASEEALKLEDAFASQFGGPGATTLSGTKPFRIKCGPRS